MVPSLFLTILIWITVAHIVFFIGSVLVRKGVELSSYGHGEQIYCIVALIMIVAFGWGMIGALADVKHTLTDVEYISLTKTKSATIVELSNGKIVDDTSARIYNADSIKVIQRKNINTYGGCVNSYYYLEVVE